MSVDTVPAPAPADAAGSPNPAPGGASGDNSSHNAAANSSANSNGNAAGQFTLRALVTSKEAGIIIGKAGKNVADLREATGVKAGVSKVVQGVPERVLSVSGTLDGVTKAYSSILQNIAENPSSQTDSLVGGISPTVHLRILVANPVMGSVIGKAGATIQALQAKHGAKIVTVKEMLPNSTERIVSIEGSLPAVDATLQELAKIVSEQDATRLQNHILYQPGSAASNTGMGMMGGMPGGLPLPVGGFAAMQQGGGFQQQHGRGPYGNNARGGNRTMSNTHHQNNNNMNNGVMRDATGAAVSQAVPTPSNPDLRTQNISIPSDMVGCIIGRGGSKINEIRQQSGAKISIAKDAHDESGERMFTITGSSEALEKALFLLYGQLEGEKEKRIQNQKQEMQTE